MTFMNVTFRYVFSRVGSNTCTGAQGLMPTRRLRFHYHWGQSTTLDYRMRERPLAGDIEKRAGMFTVLLKFS